MENHFACLFDLDGVIVDTAKYHYLAWKNLAEGLNIPFNKDDNEKLKGVSRMDSLDIILKLGNVTLSEDKKNHLATKKNAIYKEYLLKLTKESILPGVNHLLSDLKQSGYKIGIGSSSKNAPFILEQLGITNQFDVIVDGNMVTKSKPSPDIFLLGAEKLGVAPEKCVVIEDAEAGVESAIKAGMKSVGVGDETILKEADLVLSSLESLDSETLSKLIVNG